MTKDRRCFRLALLTSARLRTNGELIVNGHHFDVEWRGCLTSIGSLYGDLPLGMHAIFLALY